MSTSARAQDRRPTVLLTGTTGFVGSHLVAGLRSQSYRTIEVNRGSRSPGDNSIVWDFKSAVPEGFPRAVDIIVHCASPVGSGSTGHAQACIDLNVHATAGLIRYGEEAGVKLFVLVSSGAVYGLTDGARTESDVMAPDGAYACSKAAGEFVLRAYQSSIRAQSLRLFYPYGPGQKAPRLVPRLAERILRGQPILLNGAEGRPRMNPLYIDDLVNWAIRLMEVDGAAGAFNLAGPEILTVRQLAELLGGMLRRPVRFEHHGDVTGDSIGDATRARNTAAFVPAWSLEAGLERFVKSLSI